MIEDNITPQEEQTEFRPSLDIDPIFNKIEQIKDECRKILIDQDDLIELLIIGVLSHGHILLEGVPGIAKTLSAKVFSKTLSSNFARIQFTPDLMPLDIIGTSVFNMQSSKFEFIKGPIFSNIILIDEINRAPAKTQAALFEVMEERQISFEGQTYQMTEPFFIIATQNPIEQEGTYRLPEGQLDRFIMKINLGYPDLKGEIEILKRFKENVTGIDISKVMGVLGVKDLHSIQEILAKIHIEDGIIDYICRIVQSTRDHSKVYLGASPRASLALLKASKVAAIISGRDFVIPEDVQRLCIHVLNHRLILTPDAEMEGVSTIDIVNDLLQKVEIPR